MKRVKPVRPSLREKKRYLVFEVLSRNPIENTKNLKDTIHQSCSRYLGEKGMAAAGPILLENKWNAEKQRGLLKVSRKEVENVRAALMLTTHIGKEEAIISTIGVSGIIKKAESKFLN